MKKITCILFLLLLLLNTAIISGDVIFLNTGGKVIGKVIEKNEYEITVRTPVGITIVKQEDIDYIEEGDNLKKVYEDRLKQIKDNDAEAHYNLGVWLRNVGMPEDAKTEFQKVIAIDTDHEFARCELGYTKYGDKWLSEEEYQQANGYVKYDGKWVKKEDAEKLKQGYVKYDDEWIKKEDLEQMKKGLRRLDDKWVSQEEYYREKGYVQYQGKWMPAEKAEQLKKREEEIAIKEKALQQKRREVEGRVFLWNATICIKDDAGESFFEEFEKRIQRTSEYLWKITEGQVYIAKAIVTDKSQTGNWFVQNLDRNQVDGPNGIKAFAYCDFRRIVTGGKVDPYTTCHELGHLLWKLPDHYNEPGKDMKGKCIMQGAGGAPKFCEECWQKILAKHPKFKHTGEDKDFGAVPETIIKTNNN
ncbi:MAG: hypothetical protein ABIH42_04200 [Planctomycetota bacterium]